MLETVGQFGLHYQDQAQRIMGNLIANPSLLSRVVKAKVRMHRYFSSGTGFKLVQVKRVGPSMLMVVLCTRAELWFLSSLT